MYKGQSLRVDPLERLISAASRVAIFLCAESVRGTWWQRALAAVAVGGGGGSVIECQWPFSWERLLPLPWAGVKSTGAGGAYLGRVLFACRMSQVVQRHLAFATRSSGSGLEAVSIEHLFSPMSIVILDARRGAWALQTAAT